MCARYRRFSGGLLGLELAAGLVQALDSVEEY